MGALGSLSMTGRKSICVLCFASYTCILFIQPFQLEWGNSGSGALITHHAAQLKSVFQSEEWLVMSQEEESSKMGRNMMVFIPVCLLLVKEESLLQLLSGS